MASGNSPRGISYLGELVRKLRARKGLSQEALARACNMSTSHINKVEGTVNPRIGKGRLERLANILEIDFDTITLLSGKAPDCVVQKARDSIRYVNLVLLLVNLTDEQLDELADSARFDC